MGINSHVSAGNSHSHWGGFPFPPIPIPNFVFYFHSHGIPIPVGNPIPMHISTVQHNRLDANSFVSMKLGKQKKTTPIFLKGPIKMLGSNRKHGNFSRLMNRCSTVTGHGTSHTAGINRRLFNSTQHTTMTRTTVYLVGHKSTPAPDFQAFISSSNINQIFTISHQPHHWQGWKTPIVKHRYNILNTSRNNYRQL